MKASYKMRKRIEWIERKFGEMDKEYFVEKNESVRVGRGFYDGCQMTDKITRRAYIVAHDGTYCRMR